MIFFLILYVLFLAAYLPFNFYMVYRVHEMRIGQDRGSTAITFLVAGIALFVFVSLVAIALYQWPASFPAIGVL